ncbi:RNA-directed DNA polymerase, eukaryota, reverse transcriptase zinc-binding domain protein [Tanacetum coccineum]
MVEWIMKCVQTAFTICINSERYGYFKGGRGLRHGDPISPYLFTLVMEILTLLLQRRIRTNSMFKYHHGCKELKLINLCFGDKTSASIIKDALKEFSEVYINGILKRFLWSNGDSANGREKCLLEVRDKVASRMQFKVGNGKNILMWCDKWQYRGLLINQVSNRDLYDARIPKMTTIAEMTEDVMYVLSPNVEKVKWYELVWFKQCIPKHSFCLWLAMLRKLLTQDKIMAWGKQTGLLCPLWNKEWKVDFESMMEIVLYWKCSLGLGISIVLFDMMGEFNRGDACSAFSVNADAIGNVAMCSGISLVFGETDEFECSFSVPYDLSIDGDSEVWAEAFLARMKARWEGCKHVWGSLRMDVTATYPQAIAL